MSLQHTARSRDVFNEALERPESERESFLASACAGDPALGAEVRELLAAFENGGRAFEPVSTQTPFAPSPIRGDGSRVGQYRLRRLIGSGGMGSVYEATQEHPRRTVALKLMKQGIASRGTLRRFEYETQVLARLRHPGIAQIFEAGTHQEESGTIPYFAMEYIPAARTLTEYAAEQKLGTRQKLELFAAICDAVHHGHQKGIIHRDLKPSNILVDSEGQPKIIDFGVARATDSDMAVTTLQTDIGQLIGTVQYMSPEQCAADPHDIDTRSDVYSLGVVLYELLCEQLPYDLKRAPIHEATRIIREDSPPRPSATRKALRGDVETIVLKALEKQRPRRYQSAGELAADIRRYLRHEPIQARPPSVMYQFSMFARRNRAATAAGTSVIAILLVTSVVVSVLWMRAERLATGMQEFAAVYLEQAGDAVQTADQHGDVDVALEFLMNGERKVMGRAGLQDYPDLRAQALCALGENYSRIGYFEEAERVIKRAMAIAEENDLPLIVRGEAICDLASVYRNQRRHAEAEALFRQVLALRDPRVDSTEALADMLLDLGRAEEAAALLEQKLVRMRNASGSDNGQLYFAANLANAYRVLGQLDQAERVMQEALEFKTTMSLRDDDGVWPRFLREHGRLRLCQDRLAESRVLQQRSLQLFHPDAGLDILLARELGALIDLREGKVDEAQAEFVRVATEAEKSLQTEHRWFAAHFRVGQAECLMRQGRFEEAEGILLKSHEILDDRLGGMHHRTQNCIRILGELYDQTGRQEEADTWQGKLRREVIPKPAT